MKIFTVLITLSFFIVGCLQSNSDSPEDSMTPEDLVMPDNFSATTVYNNYPEALEASFEHPSDGLGDDTSDSIKIAQWYLQYQEEYNLSFLPLQELSSSSSNPHHISSSQQTISSETSNSSSSSTETHSSVSSRHWQIDSLIGIWTTSSSNGASQESHYLGSEIRFNENGTFDYWIQDGSSYDIYSGSGVWEWQREGVIYMGVYGLTSSVNIYFNQNSSLPSDYILGIYDWLPIYASTKPANDYFSHNSYRRLQQPVYLD